MFAVCENFTFGGLFVGDGVFDGFGLSVGIFRVVTGSVFVVLVIEIVGEGSVDISDGL